MYAKEDRLRPHEVPRIAIVGGGPGGLMTAYQLQQRYANEVDVTIYEASARLGGKILTATFESAPVMYEAGTAELYDYSGSGPDPLRELIETLGLRLQPMSGTAVVLDGHVLHSLDDVARVYGERTGRALRAFDARARAWMSPEEYYEADWRDGEQAAEWKSFHEELARVPDEAARRYLRTLVHSDLATEPHRTSDEYGMQNYLMNYASYMQLYTIEGGIEQLPQRLAEAVHARVLLEEAVVRVERGEGERLRVGSRRDGAMRSEEYDYVVVALPAAYLSAIDWRDEALAEAMHAHGIHYEHPGHYLRVTMLFREAFWSEHFQESYVMLDTFGGCCLYDESSRSGSPVLGWLLAGDAAMTAANLSDEELTKRVLDSLPEFLKGGRELLIESRVHRWIGSVSGLPGGKTPRSMELRHAPLPAMKNFMLVGDYLLDSTLNGVLDSADYVAESLMDAIAKAESATELQKASA